MEPGQSGETSGEQQSEIGIVAQDNIRIEKCVDKMTKDPGGQREKNALAAGVFQENNPSSLPSSSMPLNFNT